MKYVLCIVFILIPIPVSASVQITEVYPAPVAGDHEWVEVQNKGLEEINLHDYLLEDSSGKKLTWSENTASPGGIVTATASSVLNNAGDIVILKRTSGDIIDSVTYTQTFTPEKSFVRCSDTLEWIVSQSPSPGTDSKLMCSPTPTPVPSSIPSPQPSTTPLSPSPAVTTILPKGSITLSEIYAYPLPGEQEWVELYNRNPYEVQLSNWFIDDAENAGASPESFTITISANSYKKIILTKHMLNNGGDTIHLIEEGSVIEKITLPLQKKGQSFGKESLDSSTVCFMKPSPEQPNTGCLSENEKEQSEVAMETKSPSPTEKAPYAKPLMVVKENPQKRPPKTSSLLPKKTIPSSESIVQYGTDYVLNHEKKNWTSVLFLTGCILTISAGCIKLIYTMYQREYSYNWQLQEIPLY